jgi:hypothetical protein
MALKCPYDSGLECSLDERFAEYQRQILNIRYLGEFKADYRGPIVAQCTAWPEKCWRLQEYKQKQR